MPCARVEYTDPEFVENSTGASKIYRLGGRHCDLIALVYVTVLHICERPSRQQSCKGFDVRDEKIYSLGGPQGSA